MGTPLLLAPAGIALGVVVFSVMLIAAGWWGLVLNGWRRLTADLEERSPVSGAMFVLAGTALIAVSVWNIVDVIRTGSAFH